jgi:beta-galactosidase
MATRLKKRIMMRIGKVYSPDARPREPTGFARHTAMLAAVVTLTALPIAAQRVTIPLNGDWSIGESVGPDDVPAVFRHTVPVPGLVHSARPLFPDVDQYETQEFVGTLIRHMGLPDTGKIDTLGRTRQQRNYFWYRRTFRAPVRKQRALLVVNKAQFGTAVWLNGAKVGEHLACFTAGRFDLTEAVHWSGENRLLIRIGAHPGALPESAFFGNDGEKEFWTPGIYDDVSLLFSDAPAIESIQVAPHIQSSEIVVETELNNVGPERSVTLIQRVKAWKGGRPVGAPLVERVTLGAGEHKLVRQTIPIPGTVLWSPDHPFLYVLDTTTGGDSSTTRFGMREFHFEGERAVLNGQVIYLRGASITLHRFFADPNSGTLPWDEAWVRKFLVDIPKRMHWNAFRICIGPAPQHWLDVADEAGLLLQYEFPIWDDRAPFRKKLWKEEEIVAQFKEFVRDNWNHSSLVLWDASNETRWPFLGDKVIPAVRGLDLSSRPWENGYNGPAAPGDPYEVHPYKFSNYQFGKGPHFFEMADLEKADERKPQWPGHAAIINEFDWLWLHRDATPTNLTRKVYDHILGPNATPEQRFETYAYLLAGLTEYWRAFRKHAGVLYLAYLDAEGPHIFTCDNFRDVRTLEFQPHFEDYMREAFKPLGVYIHFWQPKLEARAKRFFRIMMVNDTGQRMTGKLMLTLEPSSSGGKPMARAAIGFDMPALGQANYDLELAVPEVQGEFLLKAVADSGKPASPTVSRRKVTIVAAAQ